MQELLSSPYLIECTPSDTQRYNDTSSVCSVPTVIPSALFKPHSFKAKTETPTPDGWQTYLNPAEGRPYFWNPGLRVFTESNITEEHVLNRLIDWSRAMRPLLNQSNRSDYDIVLKVSENMEQGMGTCHYYLVDHTLKAVFWLRETSTSALGFPDVRSPTHLKLLLSEQYWVHCEYMPPPHQNFKQNANELLGTLGTPCIDTSSSTDSVSSFHPDKRLGQQNIPEFGISFITHASESFKQMKRLWSIVTESRLKLSLMADFISIPRLYLAL